MRRKGFARRKALRCATDPVEDMPDAWPVLAVLEHLLYYDLVDPFSFPVAFLASLWVCLVHELKEMNPIG